jgi:hypothetical protein
VREYNQEHLNYHIDNKKKNSVKKMIKGLIQFSKLTSNRKLEISRKQKSDFIPPPPKKLYIKHPWYEYAIRCQKDFQKGYVRMRGEERKKWPEFENS